MKKLLLLIACQCVVLGLWAQEYNTSVEVHKPFYTDGLSHAQPIVGAGLDYRLHAYRDKLYVKVGASSNFFHQSYMMIPTGTVTADFFSYKLGLGMGYHLKWFHPSISLEYINMAQPRFYTDLIGQIQSGLTMYRFNFLGLELDFEFDISKRIFANTSYNVTISTPRNYFSYSGIGPGGCIYDPTSISPNLNVGLGYRFW